MLTDRAPRRFLRGREEPTADAVLSAFARSYADARGLRSEFAPWAKEELPRHGLIYGAPQVSLVGALDAGRRIRLAHTLQPAFGPAEDHGRRRVLREPRAVAIAELDPAEAAALAPHARDDVRVSGPYLLVERAAERDPTAAVLDAVRDDAARLADWAAAAASAT